MVAIPIKISRMKCLYWTQQCDLKGASQHTVAELILMLKTFSGNVSMYMGGDGIRKGANWG